MLNYFNTLVLSTIKILAPFNFYIRRTFSVYSVNHHENELNTIRNIAVENDFPIRIIDKLINSQKNHMEIEKTPRSNMRYCKMKYIPGLFEKLRHALFRFGVNLIATPPAKLKNLISAKIDPVPKDEVSGVYIIPLKAENIYLEFIGMTSRKLKVRINPLWGGGIKYIPPNLNKNLTRNF